MQAEILIEKMEAEKAAKMEAAWAEYRNLLLKSNANKLTDADGPKLAEVVATLGLTQTQIREHADSLRNHHAIGIKEARAKDLKTKLEKVMPRLNAATDKRAKAIAALDAEVQPLINEAQGLENEILALESAVQWGQDREPAKHPQLYGLFEKKPVPHVMTPEEKEDGELRLRYYTTALSVCASLVEAGVGDRKQYTDFTNEAIEVCCRQGWEIRSAPMTRARLPKSAQVDPRQARAVSLAKRVKYGFAAKREDLAGPAKELVEAGLRWGWISEADLERAERPEGMKVPE